MGARRADASSTLGLRLASRAEPSREHADGELDVAARLAAELGHDLNNELTAALNFSFLLAHEVEHDPVLKEHLEELQAAAWRASHLAQALRLFAPRRSHRGDRLDVNATIGAILPLLRRLAPGLQIDLHLDPRLPTTTGPRAELEQLLVGLALHARELLAPGGTIAFTTSVRSDGRGRTLRLSCVRRELVSDSTSGDMSRIVTSRPRLPWGPFRRALRTLEAKLSHDASAVHVELRLSAPSHAPPASL